jgi:two-component system, OmpR family, sensor histidine kinase KdpD
MARETEKSVPWLRHERPFLVRYGYLAAVGWVALATVAFLPLRHMLGGGQWGWPFLLVVGIVASTSGAGPGVLAAVLSFFAENFFFVPPYGSLSVQQPADLLQLLTFLFIALTWGYLAGRLRERELVAIRNEAEAAVLVEMASRVVSETSLSSMAAFVASELNGLLGTERAVVWLVDGTAVTAAGGDRPLTEADVDAARPFVAFVTAQARAVGLPAERPAGRAEGVSGPLAWPPSVHHSAVVPAPGTSDVFLPLQTPAGLDGVLQVGWAADAKAALDSHDYVLLVSAAQMVASFLAGRRLSASQAQAQAIREADRLKTALVSSVSHELKTPLASIMAVVTDLSSEDVTRDPEQVRERLGALTDDLGRLQGSISDLLDTSRLEAGQWLPRIETWEAGEIIADVVSRLPAWARGHVTFEVADPGPTVAADFAQLSRALATVVDNALLYGSADEPVVIGARRDGARTLLWVQDGGPGVPDSEKSLVFEKFYRGRAGLATKGSTGLGLSIAREIVQANGGTLWVEDASPGPGARFELSLPAEAPEQDEEADPE